MEQAQNQIYNAFQKAEFEKQAITLSTMHKKVSNGNKKQVVNPAIGHTIAIIDSMLELESQLPNRQENTKRTNFFNNSLKHISSYSIPIPGLYKNLYSILSERKDNSRLIRSYLAQESEFVKHLSNLHLRLNEGIIN
ncbi:MAG: hypothetical protein AABW67_05885 [Nanoarchaeota archaeon]